MGGSVSFESHWRHFGFSYQLTMNGQIIGLAVGVLLLFLLVLLYLSGAIWAIAAFIGMLVLVAIVGYWFLSQSGGDQDKEKARPQATSPAAAVGGYALDVFAYGPKTVKAVLVEYTDFQ